MASGFIANYAQPGGRTRALNYFPDWRTKWLELLRELIPGLATSPCSEIPLAVSRSWKCCRRQGTKVQGENHEGVCFGELEEAFATAAARRDALLVPLRRSGGARSVLAGRAAP